MKTFHSSLFTTLDVVLIKYFLVEVMGTEEHKRHDFFDCFPLKLINIKEFLFLPVSICSKRNFSMTLSITMTN